MDRVLMAALMIALVAGSAAAQSYNTTITPVTVGTLPTCNSATRPALQIVTDSFNPCGIGTLVGSGSNACFVVCLNSAWTGLPAQAGLPIITFSQLQQLPVVNNATLWCSDCDTAFFNAPAPGGAATSSGNRAGTTVLGTSSANQANPFWAAKP